MIKYLSFIFEQTFTYERRGPKNSPGSLGPGYGFNAVYNHRSTVKDIPVHVTFSRTPTEKTRRKYNMDFSVFDSYQKVSNASSNSDNEYEQRKGRQNEQLDKHAHHVLAHVATVAHTFIREKKPNKIEMVPNHSSKEPLYGKFAEHLATRYGGSVTKKHDPIFKTTSYTVHLNGKEKQKSS